MRVIQAGTGGDQAGDDVRFVVDRQLHCDGGQVVVAHSGQRRFIVTGAQVQRDQHTEAADEHRQQPRRQDIERCCQFQQHLEHYCFLSGLRKAPRIRRFYLTPTWRYHASLPPLHASREGEPSEARLGVR